jgi:dynein heavy chain
LLFHAQLVPLYTPGSSSPEPEENYPGVANGAGGRGDATATARCARYESLSGAPFYDPHETGSFPPRPPQSWTDVPSMAVMPEPRDVGDAPQGGAVFGWVPASSTENGHYVRPMTAELPVRTETSTLLELFDNPELETKTPAEWLTKSDSDAAGAPGVGAVSRYYTQQGQFAWEPCFATGYNAEDGTYTVEWKRTPGVAKRVKRLNLIFDAESAPHFRTRLATAMALREQFEAELRYHTLVENMPFTNPDILDENFRQRIMYLSGWTLSHKLPEVVEDYIESARDDYRRSVKRAILDLSLRDPEEAKRIKEEAAVKPLAPPLPVPEQGCVDPRAGGEGKLVVSHGGDKEGAPNVVEYNGEDFFILQDEIGAVLPGADKGFLKAQQQFYRELDVRGLVLVDVDERGMSLVLPQPMPLKTFDDFQRKHLAEAADMLKTELVVKVVNICQDLESETLLAAESAPDKMSKESELARRTMLPRFVKQLVLTIADQVRTVVVNSVESFAGFWVKYEGGDALMDPAEHCLPLIEVKLVVRDGDAAFEPPLEQVCDVMLAIFDDIVTSVQEIEDIRSKMSGIGGAVQAGSS